MLVGPSEFGDQLIMSFRAWTYKDMKMNVTQGAANSKLDIKKEYQLVMFVMFHLVQAFSPKFA